MQSNKRFRISILASALGAAFSLASVTASAESAANQPAATPAGNVIATVNGVNITRQELDFLYSRTSPPNLPPEVALARKRAILSELIRTEAMAQKAIELKIDKSEDFTTEMQAAKRAALAIKVEREVVSKAPQVTAQNAFDFVNKNQRMFAERQLLTLERMDMSVKEDGLLDRLDKETDNGASLDKVERLAKASRSDTRRQILSLYSDRLPPELIQVLLYKPYRPVIIKFDQDKSRGSVLYVHSAVPAPLVGQQAIQAAGNMLTSRQTQSLRQQATQAVIESAKINFYGEFAGTVLPVANSENADLEAAKLFAKPVSFILKLAIGAGLTSAAALAVLTLLTAWRYWFGIGSSRRSTNGKLRSACQSLPVIGRLLGKPEMAEELARVIASTAVREAAPKAGWPARMAMIVGLGGCSVALLLQVQAAQGKLAQWQLGAATLAGLAGGTLLSWIYVNTSLSAASRKMRWLPVSISGLLLLTVSAAGIALR